MTPRNPAPTWPDTDPDPLPVDGREQPSAPLERVCPACGQALPGQNAHQSGERSRAAPQTLAALMRAAPTLTEAGTVGQAYALFASTTTPVVVIVDPERRPLGVLTRQHVLSCLPGRTRELLGRIRAVDISTCGGAYLRPETQRSLATRLTLEGEREYVVVTDQDGKFRGVVTVYDLLAARPAP